MRRSNRATQLPNPSRCMIHGVMISGDRNLQTLYSLPIHSCSWFYKHAVQRRRCPATPACSTTLPTRSNKATLDRTIQFHIQASFWSYFPIRHGLARRRDFTRSHSNAPGYVHSATCNERHARFEIRSKCVVSTLKAALAASGCSRAGHEKHPSRTSEL